MDKTIHIEGWGSKLDILQELSDNYDIPHYGFSMDSDECEPEIVENCLLQIWHVTKECSLEEAMDGHLRVILGELYLEGSKYGYSEYTIMGFDVSTAKIGGHSIQKIVDSYPEEYLHILITQVDKD